MAMCSRRKKKASKGKRFSVFKCRQQGRTPYIVTFSEKQVGRHELSLSVDVSQSSKSEVWQQLLFEGTGTDNVILCP